MSSRFDAIDRSRITRRAEVGSFLGWMDGLFVRDGRCSFPLFSPFPLVFLSLSLASSSDRFEPSRFRSPSRPNTLVMIRTKPNDESPFHLPGCSFSMVYNKKRTNPPPPFYPLVHFSVLYSPSGPPSPTMTRQPSHRPTSLPSLETSRVVTYTLSSSCPPPFSPGGFSVRPRSSVSFPSSSRLLGFLFFFFSFLYQRIMQKKPTVDRAGVRGPDSVPPWIITRDVLRGAWGVWVRVESYI